jgi:hypothetical protein
LVKLSRAGSNRFYSIDVFGLAFGFERGHLAMKDFFWPLLASLVAAVLILGISMAIRYRRARKSQRTAARDPSLVTALPVTVNPTPRADEKAVVSADDQTVYEGKTIRFYRPKSETLQLIPGRLEVIAGEDTQEVIRFVRVPGAPAEVTFGRSEGVPLRHIQFRAGTVSRQHARMLYANSRWTITNLSRTNPVVVNSVELLPPIEQHVLDEGDEIEMGEVVFRFHTR